MNHPLDTVKENDERRKSNTKLETETVVLKVITSGSTAHPLLAVCVLQVFSR